jgi:PAS domain S-box-containing protein
MYNVLTDGEIAQLFSIFKDDQENFIQRLFRALPDTVYVMNLDNSNVIYSSRLIALEIGYSEAEVDAVNHPLLDIMHPSDKKHFLDHLDEVKRSKPGEVLSLEYRLIRHDGTIAWFVDRNTIFTRKPSGAGQTKIGITHEITERKVQQLKIEKQLKVIEELEALSKSGSWEYDRSTKAFGWSPGMYRLFNLSPHTRVVPDIYKEYCIEEDSTIAERIVDFIEHGQGTLGETLRIKADGTVRHLEIKAAPLAKHADDNNIIVGVDMDVSGTIEKQSLLEQLNADLEFKNRQNRSLHDDMKMFADISAMEYHSTFQTLYTSFELLISSEAGKFSNNGKAVVRKMQGTLQRMNLLTNDIVAYLSIKKDETRVQEVSLDEIVDHVLTDFKDVISTYGIAVHKEPLGFIHGDFHLLYILMRHVVDNALKFRNTDGIHSIRIYSCVSEMSLDNFHSGEHEKVKQVCIEDNGPGIKPDDDQKIFDLFYKNHYGSKLKGSGVGLAVAKKIIEAHNGYIAADTSMPQGSRFILSFKDV